MSREILHAWVCGEYAGHFERDFEMDRPRFIYDAGFQGLLSVSLPQEKVQSDSTSPGAYLEGLLPERETARQQIQQASGARTMESWDLLSAIGGDLPGGVVLHPERDGPEQEDPYTRPALDEVVATRIVDIKAGGTGMEFPGGQKPRFSLAGAQSKFALVRMQGLSFWSDSATPSTHIVKPESSEHSGLELIEAATLHLANRVGVEAPQAEQVSFAGQTAFQILRFDRSTDGEVTNRIHAEDMTQALGLPSSAKYSVDSSEIVRLLREHTGGDELGYEFYRQYAFNALIGNSDGHGKNYSILHSSEGIALSPLYDSIPISMFPDYSQELAMPVGWNERFTSVTADDWEDSAAESGLDPDRVLNIVSKLSESILEQLDHTLGGVRHPRVTARALAPIRKSCETQTQRRDQLFERKVLDLKPGARSASTALRGNIGQGHTPSDGNAG